MDANRTVVSSANRSTGCHYPELEGHYSAEWFVIYFIYMRLSLYIRPDGELRLKPACAGTELCDGGQYFVRQCSAALDGEQVCKFARVSRDYFLVTDTRTGMLTTVPFGLSHTPRYCQYFRSVRESRDH
eukprot:scpid107581/ scgid34373/ 